MSEFEILLERAGHRPPKRDGGKWTCAHCPERKLPALSVNLQKEVWYCQRCRQGGGLVALKRALGEPTKVFTSREKQIRRAAEVEGIRIKRWFDGNRRGIIDQFKHHYDAELQAESKARTELQLRGEVTEGTLDEYSKSARERELLEVELQAMDGMPIQDIVELFEEMRCSNMSMGM